MIKPTNPNKLPIQTTEKSLLRHNFIVEVLFSAFNGVFLGLIWFGAHVVAERGLEAGPVHLAILVCAFPAGAFLGPIWAALGKRWGMKTLVCVTLCIGGAALLPVYWVTDIWAFTALVAFAQLMNSAMRMGQSTMYRMIYPQEKRGQILGYLTFCSYATMVPGMLLTGWLLDESRTSFQFVYPVAGICALIASVLYCQLRVPDKEARATAGGVGFGSDIAKYRRVLRRDRLYLLYEIAFFFTGGAFFLSRPVIVELTGQRFTFPAWEMMLVLSVLPPILLAVGSPFWGWVFDQVGLLRCRLIISFLLCASMICFICGLIWRIPVLLYGGSILQGISSGGGTLTWFLGSALLARRSEDVPLYNGIHFVLNGVRGLALPWVGAGLLALFGPVSLFGAFAFSLVSIPILVRALALKDKRNDGKPILWFVARKKSEKKKIEIAVPAKLEPVLQPAGENSGT